MPTTEVIHASDIVRVAIRIYRLRNPKAVPAYRRALRKYERDLAAGNHREVDITTSGIFTRSTVRGYQVIGDDGLAQTIERPVAPSFGLYNHMPYYRGFGGASHAEIGGLLAGATYNRDIRPARVEEYAAAMRAGLWRDLLSDPITITDDGQVVNGQHRLAAMREVIDNDGRSWKAPNDPAFLVIWGVDPQEAQHADGSRRTQRDERMIADKLLAAAK